MNGVIENIKKRKYEGMADYAFIRPQDINDGTLFRGQVDIVYSNQDTIGNQMIQEYVFPKYHIAECKKCQIVNEINKEFKE